MLVLSRRRNEEIRVPGFDITFRVLEVRGNSVRVGVEAPSNVRILRGELLGEEEVEFDFAARELEADAEYKDPGYVWPLGVCYRPTRSVAKCA